MTVYTSSVAYLVGQVALATASAGMEVLRAVVGAFEGARPSGLPAHPPP